MTAARSNRREVRNPVLKLPAAKRLIAFLADQPELRAEFRGLLRDLRAEAVAEGEKCWRKHKGPMAAYHKAAGVYAGHIARVLK